MANNTELLIRIRADIRQALDDLRTTQAELNRVGREGKEAGSGLNQAGRGARNAGQGLERTGRGAREAAAGLEHNAAAADRAAAAQRRVGAAAAHSRRAFDGLKLAAAGAVGVFAAVRLTRSLVEANQQLQKIKFTLQAVTGSAAGANKEFDFLSGAAKRLGLDLPTAAAGYARLAASAKEANLPTAALHQGFLGLSEALTVLHAPADEVNRILIQLDQGLSLGRIQMQDLRAISNSIPGTFGLVEEAFKGTDQSLQDMLAHGGIPAQQFFERFTALLHDKYGPAAEQASNGLQASLNKLKTTIFETEAGSQSTFVASFTDAVQNLNQTLSDPAIQQGIASLVSGLGEAAKFAAELAADVGKVGSGLGIFAAKIAGFADPNDQLAQAQDRIAEINHDLQVLNSRSFFTHHVLAAGVLAQENIEGGVTETNIKLALARLTRERGLLQDAVKRLKTGHPNVDYLAPGSKGAQASQYQSILGTNALVKGLLQSGSTVTPPAAPQASAAAGKLIAQLQKQAATYGKTARQVLEYKLDTEQATDAQKRQALALFDQLARQKQATQAKKAAAAAAKAQAQAEDQLNATLDKQVEQQDATLAHILDTVDPAGAAARAAAVAQAQAQAFVRSGEITQQVAEQYAALVKQSHTATTQMSQFAIEAARNIQDSFAQFLFDPVKEGFSGLVSGFADALRKMAAQALASQLLGALLGKNFGQSGQVSSGSYLGQFASIAAGLFHTGGTVGAPPATRAVSPLVFAAAPRYHLGGLAGLKPDERPAILQTGERVLSRDQVKQGAGQGAQGVQGVRIVNVIDPAMAQDYLQSSAGEKVVLNVLRRNAGTVKQVLA